MDLVEVLRRDAGCDLVHDRYAGDVVAAALEQVHDVAPGDEEAVRVAELCEPGCECIGVLFGRLLFRGFTHT